MLGLYFEGGNTLFQHGPAGAFEQKPTVLRYGLDTAGFFLNLNIFAFNPRKPLPKINIRFIISPQYKKVKYFIHIPQQMQDMNFKLILYFSQTLFRIACIYQCLEYQDSSLF